MPDPLDALASRQSARPEPRSGSYSPVWSCAAWGRHVTKHSLATLLAVLTCQAVVELITDSLEDALPARDRGAYEVHLASCAACTVFVDQMRRTVYALRTVGPDLPIPPCDELVETFRDYRGGDG